MTTKTMGKVMIAAMLLAACRADDKPTPIVVQAPATAAPAIVGADGSVTTVVTYEVPAGHDADIEEAFSAIRYPITVAGKNGAETEMQQVRPVFANATHVAVAAPASMQAGIADVLKQIAAAPASLHQTYNVTVWVIGAEPADKTEVTSDLVELRSALDGLTALGPRHYKVVDRYSTLLMAGRTGTALTRTSHAYFELQAASGGLQIHARLDANLDAAYQIDTSFVAEPGKLVVLGDAAGAPAPALGGGTSMLLYVVRATPTT